MSTRKVILLFGLVNASLYSALLPLWEGFDEPFHYGYVETLWQTGRLLQLGRALVPQDVLRSFEFAPISAVVHAWIPQGLTFGEWNLLGDNAKRERRTSLELLRPEFVSGPRPNYEAHHPPLAYVCLALLDWWMAGAPITVRVLLLRLFAAWCATFLIYVGAERLFRTLEMPEGFANAALLTLFCSQMLYATTAHVANDWLAVGLSALFLGAVAEFVNRPDRRSALILAAWLSAGLLTKAYFLVFALFAVAVAVRLVWRGRVRTRELVAAMVLVAVLAGPWYVRNLLLYKTVSGTQEEFDGTGWRESLSAVPRMHWMATTKFLALSSLWTGNNTFNNFSRGTLEIMLVLLFVGLAAWVYRRSAIAAAERALCGSIVLFALAIGYMSCAAFAHTNGVVEGASPWYAQVLLVPVLALVYLGFSRWPRVGTHLAVGMVAVWTWVLVATWVIKLFPTYSGAGLAPMHFHEVWEWYSRDAAAHAGNLALLALAPAGWLYTGLAVSLALSMGLSVWVIRGLKSGFKVHYVVR